MASEAVSGEGDELGREARELSAKKRAACGACSAAGAAGGLFGTAVGVSSSSISNSSCLICCDSFSEERSMRCDSTLGVR